VGDADELELGDDRGCGCGCAVVVASLLMVLLGVYGAWALTVDLWP
jgi:hypothetical protein